MILFVLRHVYYKQCQKRVHSLPSGVHMSTRGCTFLDMCSQCAYVCPSICHSYILKECIEESVLKSAHPGSTHNKVLYNTISVQ